MIKISDKLYTQALELFTGSQRTRLNGTDLDIYNAGVSSPLLFYIAPTYNTATHKLGVLIEIPDNECTHTTPTKTQAEVDADLIFERESMLLTRLQFRKGVNAAGAQKRADLDAYIQTLTRNEQDEWLHQDLYNRLDPLILGIQAALVLTDNQMDSFFRNNATL